MVRARKDAASGILVGCGSGCAVTNKSERAPAIVSSDSFGRLNRAKRRMALLDGMGASALDYSGGGGAPASIIISNSFNNYNPTGRANDPGTELEAEIKRRLGVI